MVDSLMVLVVEDDPAIQMLIDEALREGGYETSMVMSGEEAVPLLQRDRGQYRALVSDINLKGAMDGWEIARHAREIDSAFPVVYMTGAAAEIQMGTLTTGIIQGCSEPSGYMIRSLRVANAKVMPPP